MERDHRTEDELERLRRENRNLDDQVKLLVQTEQRLYRLRKEIDRQLTRLQALGDFALECSPSEPPETTVDRALGLLLSCFDMDRAAAVSLPRENGTTSNILMRTTGGSPIEQRTKAIPASLAERVAALPRAALLGATDTLHDELDELLDELGPRDRDRSTVCVPLRSGDGEFRGFLAAFRSAGSRGSHYREPVGEEHLPFLHLLTNHLEHALQNAALTIDLRDRGELLAETNHRLVTSLQHLETTQQQLLQAKKLEAIGRLSGGIAHDFNNLLTVILGHAELLRDRLPASSRDTQDVAGIIEASQRAAEIIGHLLAFSRKQKQTPELIDVSELARSMTRMLGRLIGEHITLVLSAAPELPRVRADRAHVEQILMNLVVNARDAMPDGGTLTIETRLGEASGHEVLEGEADDECVALVVTDTGHGMDPTTCAQIFEPFFTTKDVGRGTGMGLATVYGLVTQNEGHIQVDSAVDQGSRFTVIFPASTESFDEIDETPGNGPVKRTEATVLLAEDEQSIRELFSEVLRAAGFEVLEAADGQEALEVARGHRGVIDLVICDVVMPRRGGVEFVKELRAESPGLTVLFISGYTFESLKVEELAGEHFLQKPLPPSRLIQHVREILQQRRIVPLPLHRRHRSSR